jgi:hypothetical protein
MHKNRSAACAAEQGVIWKGMNKIKLLFIIFLLFSAIGCKYSSLSTDQIEKELYFLTPVGEDLNTVKSRLSEEFGSSAIVGFGSAKYIEKEWRLDGWHADFNKIPNTQPYFITYKLGGTIKITYGTWFFNSENTLKKISVKKEIDSI